MPISRLTVDLDDKATEAKARIPFGMIKPIMTHFLYKLGHIALHDYGTLFAMYNGDYTIVKNPQAKEDTDGHG